MIYVREQFYSNLRGAMRPGSNKAEDGVAQWLLRDVLAFGQGEIDALLCTHLPRIWAGSS
jgi:hypothetical protein